MTPAPAPERTCAHCGQRCGDYAGGLGGILTADGGIDLCHPNGVPPAGPVTRPDCYRRVTVYGEPLGALVNVEPKPAGIEDIHVAETAACRHCGDRIIPCSHAVLFCKGWKHVQFITSKPIGAHYCGGRSVNPVAEPAA